MDLLLVSSSRPYEPTEHQEEFVLAPSACLSEGQMHQASSFVTLQVDDAGLMVADRSKRPSWLIAARMHILYRFMLLPLPRI